MIRLTPLWVSYYRALSFLLLIIVLLAGHLLENFIPYYVLIFSTMFFLALSHLILRIAYK
jgi:hypothetical protein